MAFRKENDSFTHSIFVFQHGINTIIYSLGTYHLTFKSYGGIDIFPAEPENPFYPKQKSIFLSDMENQYFFQILPKIFRLKL